MKHYLKYKFIFNKSHSRNALLLCICIVIIFLQSCQNEQPLFRKINSSQSGIDFKNEIIENDTHNILNFTNLYTGSGVGIGDFNKDGLPDIFFGGNMESSRLYLNKGGFRFEDITLAAGVTTDRWVTGVAVVDINADGWDDIYLCVSGNAMEEKRRNLLFINNQNTQGDSGQITFTEQAEKYGIADPAQCTHGNFFDYDKDGDLDLFVIVNPTDYKLYNVNNIRRKKLKGEATSTDKLYQNNGDGTFSDVSTEAGILIEGYSLGLNISDLNNDGWTDIYITNDFLTNDILYINNQDGTFTNRAAEMLKHTSFASMGIDVADINNDGQPEIYVLDMYPEDNYREKMIMGSDNYNRFQYLLKQGYEPQYSRNTLQLNNGDGTFSEIGQMANVHKTDWSWSALLADLDNDGLRDLYVTNGFRRDLGNLDYIKYENTNPFGSPESRKKKQLDRILQQPGAQIPNYVFKNENGLTFSKKSKEWGVGEPSYSHGAAYADLDADGDLDLIVNNVSQPVFIYENKAETLTQNNYLKIKLETNPLSTPSSGRTSTHSEITIGTKVWIFYNNKMQHTEYTPYRGYQSSVENILHFGLGKVGEIDSIKVRWTDGSFSFLENVDVNQTLVVKKNNNAIARSGELFRPSRTLANTDKVTITEESQRDEISVGKQHGSPRQLFESQREGKKLHQKTSAKKDKSTSTGTAYFSYNHQEDPQVDFQTQLLLPHQHSNAGPHISVGDINGDKLEDVFIGGAAGYSGTFFIQNPNQTFTQKELNQDKEREDVNSLLFDTDGDGDLDLYVVSGGVIAFGKKEIYQDRLYFNEGGVFSKKENALPEMYTSGSVVVAADYDGDGDLDLFVGGRVTPQGYPEIPQSYLLENQNGIFKNNTPTGLSNIGMVSSALWSDYDSDGDKDLLLAGEFMPITIFKNEKGQLKSFDQLNFTNGWWNTLAEGDFDNDGDMDYLAGNLGLNSNLKSSEKEPVSLYANDFDKNGSIDPVLSQFLEGKEYPVASRDKLIAQIPPIKKRFNNYASYAEATFSNILKRPEKRGMQVLKAQTFASSYIENLGNGKFKIHPLPLEMQIAPLQDFLVEDFNLDGNLDALVVGNSYATEVGIGRYDAFTGAVMLGNGKGDFEIKRGAECGFVADKDARSLVKVGLTSGDNIYIVGNNSDALQIFTKTKSKPHKVTPVTL